MKKTYAFVGASGRALCSYARPMVSEFSDCAAIVGVFDPNPLRIEALKKAAAICCPAYTDFDKMITEKRPDTCIITSVDSTHDEYIVKCLRAGVDVITEKPMATDAGKCRSILDAELLTGRKVTVTFNCRYATYTTAVKQAIEDGLVGQILNVHFEYMLDTSHGADYFRRWHRRKENSGGLLVHKSTHHFDLVNWWIDEKPEEVMAYGTRRFYGPTRTERGERCLTCRYKRTCEFYFDINDESSEVGGISSFNKLMYSRCEEADDYYRDRCVFADEIDIEDTMSVNVKYSEGALLSYSLIAHCPYEGYKASINGTRGRLEVAEYYSGARQDEPYSYFDLYDRKGRKIAYAIPKAEGAHGGGDERLLRMIFRGDVTDLLGRQAGSMDGAMSVIIGIAANKSIAEGRNIGIADLLPLDSYENRSRQEIDRLEPISTV